MMSTVGARMALIVGVAVGFALGAASAQASFLPSISYSVGASASAIGYGDFNDDGIPDLVIARPADDDVVIMFGRADGTFSPPSAPIPVGSDPVSVTSCIPMDAYRVGYVAGPSFPVPDFNSDMHCDLAVSDAGSDQIAVLIGNGDGTFQKPIFIPTDGTPGAIVATHAGLNYEGVVFTEPAQNRVGTIRFLDGSSYLGPTWTPVGSDPSALVTSYDPLSDGWTVAVADTGSSDVQQLEAVSGDPPWVQIGDWSVGPDPEALAAGAFGPGGSLGYAVADGSSNDVRLLGFQQEGEYLYSVQSSPIPVGADPMAMVPLTGPGDPADSGLAILNGGAGTVTILRQTSAGSTNDGSWPSYSSSLVPVPATATQLVAQPFRPELDYTAQVFASPPATDLAALDPAGSVSVLLQRAPRLMLTPTSLKFGHVTSGTSSAAQLSVTNVGQIASRVDHIELSGPMAGPFTVDAGSCTGTTLDPGQSCAMTLRFHADSPGGWGGLLFAFTSPDQSSVFGTAHFDGSADLHAAVTSPSQQGVAAVLRAGVRMAGTCSASCSLTIHALLARKKTTAEPAKTSALAVIRLRLRHRGRVRLHMQLPAWTHKQPGLPTAHILLRGTAQGTAYERGSTKKVRVTLKPVAVRLTAR